MLQRAASNAYSWWWASHIRTKQSKWLGQNLQDMEEKVTSMLNIIDDDGDSFAQRAEMYYRKRPELVSIVEDSYRAYRALAERYDHLSKDLQSANRTIATVFPDRIPYALDEEDEENVSQTSHSSLNNPDTPRVPTPKVPKAPFPKKDFRSRSMFLPRKGQVKKAIASAKPAAFAFPSSGLSKDEALAETDKLQKDILELQTEREFVKNSYERGYATFCELEDKITEKQKRACNLQEEFGLGSDIDDNEARTLMATRALKSCQDSLANLKEKHEQATEEARVETRRIRHVNDKFEAIRNKFNSPQINENENNHHGSPTEFDNMFYEINNVEKERQALEALQKEIEEKLDMNSNATLTISQLAEKIDDLVQRVVNLETAVFSENALVKRLKLEVNELQAHVKSLEEDKEALIEGSEVTNKRINKLEEELSRVKDLVKTVVDQNNSLRTHFTEASCDINHLSLKLQDVKMEEEVENTAEIPEEETTVSDEKPEGEMEQQNKTELAPPAESSGMEEDTRTEMEGKDKDVSAKGDNNVDDESSSNLFDGDGDSKKGMGKKYLSETASSIPDTEMEEVGSYDEIEQPDWRQLYLSGLDDREKILLDEYSSVLRNYKEVRKKLNEVDKKNREGFFELALQIRELKNALASRDGEIQSLRQKVGFVEEDKDGNMVELEAPRISASLELESTLTESVQASPIPVGQGKGNQTPKKNEENVEQEKPESESRAVLTVEDKIRSSIDDLLEENLEFWLRFSTSFHQIQKYQTSLKDLKAELSTLREKKNQEGSGKRGAIKSEARAIYSHLREIKTELSLWLENNAVLKEEVQGRYSSLCNIQEEIAKVTNVNGQAGETELNGFQSAKFQGEVLNMKQESIKVSNELKAGLDRVKQLKQEVEKVMEELEPETGASASHTHHTGSRRPRIPLRSFLFGIKLKNKRAASMFACGHPTLQRQKSYIIQPAPTELSE